MLTPTRHIGAAVCAFALTTHAHAQSIESAVQAVAPRMIELRHTLHRNPELSNRETRTAALLADELRALGIEVETGVAGTGVVGILRGGRPGPVVALRADIDALPVTEDTGFAFASTQRTTFQGQEVGVAHACGHDIHMAVQIGTAAVLADMRESLAGTVKFIFQPAEEGPPPGERGGAELMVEQGAMQNPTPEAIFALHAWPNIPVGQIAYTPGPWMASSDSFYVTLRGQQIHGANPHLGIDPVVLAAQAVLALQTIPSRSLDPLEPAVLTVGTIAGGQRFNIIPGEVKISGTVRTFSSEVQDTIERRMREILDGLTAAAGASYDLEYRRATPFLNNDEGLGPWATKSLRGSLGPDGVVPGPRTMTAEDFAVFANLVPAVHFRLGVTAPGTETGGLHTPDFRADDGAIAVGITAMTGLVLDYINATPPRAE